MIRRFKRGIRKRIDSVIASAMERTIQSRLQQRDREAKAAYAVKVAQRTLFVQYQNMTCAGKVPPIDDTGYRVYD